MTQQGNKASTRGYLVMGVDPQKERHIAVAIIQDFASQAKLKFDNISG